MTENGTTKVVCQVQVTTGVLQVPMMTGNTMIGINVICRRVTLSMARQSQSLVIPLNAAVMPHVRAQTETFQQNVNATVAFTQTQTQKKDVLNAQKIPIAQELNRGQIQMRMPLQCQQLKITSLHQSLVIPLNAALMKSV